MPTIASNECPYEVRVGGGVLMNRWGYSAWYAGSLRTGWTFWLVFAGTFSVTQSLGTNRRRLRVKYGRFTLVKGGKIDTYLPKMEKSISASI